jgi:hypothetical protein
MNIYEKICGLLTEAKGGGKGFQPRVRTRGGQAAHGVTLGRDEQYLRSNVERLRAMADRAGRPYSPVLQAMIDRLAKNPNPDAQTRRQDASTETNMNGYEKIIEMLGGGTPSHKAPGHEQRMAAHTKRIQSHPEFEEPDPKAKARGAKGAKKTNTKKKSSEK